MTKPTMTRSTKMLFVTAAALAAAGVIAIGRRVTASSATTSTAAPPAGATGPGQQRRWALKLETTMRQGGRGGTAQDAAHSSATVLTGDWVVTVSAASPAGAEVACQIENPHIAGSGFGAISGQDVARLEKDLGRRFWVSYQADGAAKQLHFPRDMGDDVRNFLALLVTQTQLVHAVGPTSHWTATERDGAGAYLAAYEQLEPGKIGKRKLRYVAVDGAATAGGASMGVRLVSAETRFTLDAGGGVAEVNGREISQLDSKMGAPELGVEIDVHMDHARSAVASALVGSLERARATVETGPVVTQRAMAEELQSRYDARLVQNLTIAQVLKDLGEGRGTDATASTLAAIFRQRPSDIPAAAAFVRQAKPEAAKMVLQALGVAGTEGAQSALVAVATDEHAPAGLRVAAVGGFVQTRQPTAATIATLIGLMDSPEPGLRRQALYMAGTVGSNGHDKDPAGTARIEAELLGRYATCTGARCLDVLAALGNLATAAVVPSITRALKDQRADVRASGVQALRKVKDPAAERLISTTMMTDGDPNVRAAAILATTFRPIGAFIEPLAHTAKADPVDYVRSAAINSMANHIDESAVIQQALVVAATEDVKPGVRRLARKALGPRGKDLPDL